MNTDICVIGLGYVGLPLAVMFAAKGKRVYGIEKHTDVLAMLKEGKPHIQEPSLPELLAETLGNNRLSIHSTIPPDCSQSPIDYVITVGTPLDNDYRCRLDMIENASHEIAAALKDGDSVILRSTVRPGTTRNICKRIFDKTGKDYSLSFCPERIVEGIAIAELTEIPTIIGSDSEKGFARASALFGTLTKDVLKVKTIETAEVIKLINNMTRDLSFALSNQIGVICEELEVDASEVFWAATAGYERAALPTVGLVGGPCLTKDIYLLDEGMEESEFSPSLGLIARETNDYVPRHGAKNMAQYCRQFGKHEAPIKICFLGLAFKGRPPTNDVRGSLVSNILHELKQNLNIASAHGYDPEVSHEDALSLGVEKLPTLADCFQNMDIVIITNNHKAIDELSFEKITDTMADQGLLYDFWPHNRERPTNLRSDIAYIGFGEGALIAAVQNGAQ